MEMKHTSLRAEYDSLFMAHLRQTQYIRVALPFDFSESAGKVSCSGLANGSYRDFFITALQNKKYPESIRRVLWRLK